MCGVWANAGKVELPAATIAQTLDRDAEHDTGAHASNRHQKQLARRRLRFVRRFTVARCLAGGTFEQGRYIQRPIFHRVHQLLALKVFLLLLKVVLLAEVLKLISRVARGVVLM